MKKNPKFNFDLVLVNDQKMRALNKRHRGLDKASNVISFSFDEVIDGILYLGPVVINLDEAEREAKILKIKLREELVRLGEHGVRNLLRESRHLSPTLASRQV